MAAESYKSFTLITGASGGLGAEFAQLCAAEGRNLILVARRGDRLKALAKKLGRDITVHIIVQDLAEHGAAQKVYSRVRRLRATVDQLINNAGVGDYGEFSRTVIARQQQIIDLNITALTQLTHLFLPDMIKRKHGRILNIGSTASFVPVPRFSVYAASKSYVLSFSEALSIELKGSGVTVTCLCPGPTKTGFGRTARVDSRHPLTRTKTSAASVARFGYRAMLAGTVVTVYGRKNRLLVNVLRRFASRAATRRRMARYGAS